MCARCRRRESGFSLIELMITVAIVGVLAAIAIPVYSSFLARSRHTEARLHLDQLARRVRLYHHEKRQLPDSATLFPATTACASPTGMIEPQPQSAWDADPGWRTLGFHVDDPSYFQYNWTKLTPTEGHATALGDLDCDGIPALSIVVIGLDEGNTFEQTLAYIEE